MLTFKIDERFYGYAVEFSPFIPSRFACAAAENYGLNGGFITLIDWPK